MLARVSVLASRCLDERPRAPRGARAARATRGEGGGPSDLEGPDRGVVWMLCRR